MCGIAAILFPDVAPPARAVRLASERLGHRGPDGTNSVRVPGCDLGHTRLSIIDLAGGSQPMGEETGRFWLTFNGEIFNYRELRVELEAHGWRFRTASDTEVLLRSYQQWGEQCVGRLQGQFAFVVWDAAERRAFAARDRMGEKPLYWAHTEAGGLALASEIKALLATGLVSPRLDLAAVDAYLWLFYVPPDRTIYQNVFTVPPAGAMVWDGGAGGRLRAWRYWEPSLSTNHSVDGPDAVAEVRRLVNQAVKRQMVADVPVGAFLSGGLDSSTIVALMTRHTAGPVMTFSVGFGDLINELPYARAVAEAYQTDHHELQMEMPLADTVERMAEVYDEPFGDSSNVPTYLMSGFAAKYVKVALAGDGGDEVFGGYSWYLPELGGPPEGAGAPLGLRRLRSLAWRAAGRVGLPVGARRDTAVHALLGGVLRRRHPDLWDRHLSLATLIDEPRADLWGGRDAGARRAAAGEAVVHSFCPVQGLRGMDRAVDFDLRCYLPGDILVKVDRAAMAHGLETRAPFLDVDLVSFVLSLPWSLRFKRYQGTPLKPLLRQACEELWPAVVRGRGKMGFGAPVQQWVRRPDVRRLLSRVCAAGSPLAAVLPGAPTRIKPLLALNAAPPWPKAQLAWSLLCLGLWLERHVECLSDLPTGVQRG